jgi:aromatic-L-amino-acid decarboxylase
MFQGTDSGGGEIEAKVAASGQTLDPPNWKGFRVQAHSMMDDMLDYIEHIRERPVWQPIPDERRARFRAAVPYQPTDLGTVHQEFMQEVLPFAGGNVHPGFMGWVQGGGTPVGMLAEMLAAGLNANLGGRDHIPIEVERQIVRWVREIFGFPESATGLFVTGTSMANLIATVVARDTALGFEVCQDGISRAQKRPMAYASNAVHGCIAKAMDISGVGRDALRSITTDDRRRIDLDSLEEAIEQDRRMGYVPFLVIGTAGTTDTGAIDDLDGLADLCRRQKIWFHVDGAYGALAMLAPELAPRLKGVERADSLAFDFHKWGQVPYDAGFLLVRNGTLHRKAFVASAAYLQREVRGMAAGSHWPCDYGPDLSRGFHALKTWFTLKVYGTEALGATIAHTCQLARYLESRIVETPELELMAPVELNIVCFRYCLGLSAEIGKEESDRINREIVIELQESGKVAPSSTTLDGNFSIRAAIVNHRTSLTEIDTLIKQTLDLGRALRSRYLAN